MKNRNIIPTVFSYDKKSFDKRFKKIISISDKIHIDFMDGKFVKSKSVLLKDVPNLKRYKKMFEAHLMVERPEKWVKECKTKGFSKIIFHIESSTAEKAHEIVKLSRKLGLKCYIAINPKTKIQRIYPFISGASECDGVLVMGVKPGREGQKMFSRTPERVRIIKKFNKRIKVQIDGGVNSVDIKLLAGAGADYINSGSFVADSRDPKEQIDFLEKLFIKGRRSTKV